MSSMVKSVDQRAELTHPDPSLSPQISGGGICLNKRPNNLPPRRPSKFSSANLQKDWQFAMPNGGAGLATKGGVSGNRLTLNEFRASMPGVPLDTVFRALDGRDLDVDGDACHVAVCGIYEAGGQRWVQLALAGSRPMMLTIRIGVEPLDVVSKFT